MTGRRCFRPYVIGAFWCALAQGICSSTGALAATSSPMMSDLQNILVSSHVTTAQQLETGVDSHAFYWRANNLQGSARELAPLPGGDLMKTAELYLQGISFSCKGQFAERLGQPRRTGDVTTLQADTACVDGGNNPASAVLFVTHQGGLGVIVQKGAVGQLSSAMINVDALVSAAVALPDHAPPPAVQETTIQPQAPEPIAAPSSPQETVSQNIPAEQAKAVPVAPAPRAAYRRNDLSTWSGFTFGLEISRYKYREQTGNANPFVDISSYPMGVTAAYTTPPLQGLSDAYFRLDGRFALGPAHYSSASGTASGQTNNIWEIRGLIGKDYTYGPVDLSPYTGYGFRYLYNDARGLTSLGSAGYRRQSTYQYIPIGLTSRFRLTDAARLSVNTEYDFFTAGTQKSYLSDANAAYGNIVNHQSHGMGLRGSVMFQQSGWSVGPWFDYWHIKDSNVVPIPGDPGHIGMEPDNTTTEVGLRITRTM